MFYILLFAAQCVAASIVGSRSRSSRRFASFAGPQIVVMEPKCLREYLTKFDFVSVDIFVGGVVESVYENGKLSYYLKLGGGGGGVISLCYDFLMPLYFFILALV